MASKYDKIQTARDLVMEVKFHGFSLNPDDICRAQDIFGHSTIEELDTLANDIGRNNENGEPDPKGTWSSTRPPTRDTFYSILFQIWNWEEATSFWNEHSNPEREQIAVIKSENQTQRAEIKELEKRIERYQEELDLAQEAEAAAKERAKEYAYQIDDLKATIESKDAEIMRLKAKLYDLLTKE